MPFVRRTSLWVVTFIALIHLSSATAIATSECSPTCYSQELTPLCNEQFVFSPNIQPTIVKADEPIIAAKAVTLTPSKASSFIPTPSTPPPTPTTATTPTPTQSPPTPTPEPTPASTPPADHPGGLSADVLFSLINSHRQSLGLPEYQKDDRLCTIANARAPQLNNEIFGSSHVHAGFDSLDLEYWITENMVHQPSEQAALSWWLNSSLHRQAIESTIHTHSCGACVGNTCAQLFTSWQPK